MQRLNTAYRPINTTQLALKTMRIPKAQRNLQGFFDVLDLGEFLDQGKQDLRTYLNRAANGDRDAHIAAQNKAGNDMNMIVNQYLQYKGAGTLTVSIISQAQAAIQGVINNFKEFAREVGSSRALQGAADIEFYGSAAIGDMERDKAQLTGNVYFPGTSTGGGSSFPTFIQTASSYLPVILGTAFLFMLPSFLKSSRKGN